MTDDELKSYYADLLILQFRSKPKAYATIKALVSGLIQNQLPFDLQDAFNIETAVGAQLDVLGEKYAGISRLVNTFSSGTIVLSDSDYRKLVKMKLILNNSDSSLADIQNLIATYFPDALQVFDTANMRLSYYFDATYGSQDLAEAFVAQNLLPKPMGVQLSAVMYVATLVDIYGWVSYDIPTEQGTHGFNTYAVYDSPSPWLSYADALY